MKHFLATLTLLLILIPRLSFTQCLGSFQCDALDASLLEPMTDISGEINFIEVESCFDGASITNPQDLCTAIEKPVKWFRVDTDADAARLYVHITKAGNWDPVFSVYSGECDNLEAIFDENSNGPCSSDWAFEEQIAVPVNTNSAYFIAVSTEDSVNENEAFTLNVSTTITPIICLGDGFCNLDILEVTYRSEDPDGSLGLSLDGPFYPEETIRICADYEYNATETGVDWLIGVIPFFSGFENQCAYPFSNESVLGNGMEAEWFDDGIAELQEEVVSLCISTDENGKMQLCNGICLACDCDLGLTPDTPMPGGWFWLTTGGNAGCENSGVPHEHWGIGSTMASINLCVDAKVGYPNYSQPNKSKITMGLQTFSDGVLGCWEDPVGECLIDEPLFSSWDFQCEGEDADGDGYEASCDCDDSNASINPSMVEIPDNGIDENCDGKGGQDDLDGDGFSGICDCDETNPDVNTGQAEIPYNGIDDDCNEATPDDDLDGDGFGFEEDCNDDNPAINPSAEELCNEIDDNCNGEIDEDVEIITYYVDADEDGYGDPETAMEDCLQPEGTVLNGEDCDDANPEINPDAIDIPNNDIDENCDGMDFTSSLSDIVSSNVIVSPIPTSDILQIKTAQQGELEVNMYNVDGQRVYGTRFTRTVSIDVRSFSPGIYWMQFSERGEVITFKKCIVH